MRIGVPGEFHEDRWQRTAEDSERCMIPRTREAGGAHRIQVIAWRRGLLDGLWHGHHAHSYLRGIPAWRRGLLDGLRHDHPAHRYLSGIPAWQRTNTDRPLARRPCPQVLPGHPRVAKSHLTKDKPVSARCKGQLSYCRAYRQTYRMVSYVGLTDRQTGHPYRPPYRRVSSARLFDRQTARLSDHQTGLPYRQPYLMLSPAGSHGSSLPDGFIRQTYRQVSFQRPDRPASPVARPAALPAASPVARPAASPASHTGHPHRQPHQPSSPAILTGHPHRPSTPAKVAPSPLTDRLRSAGRRLRGWRSSRHG